jgi:hypothetical protein
MIIFNLIIFLPTYLYSIINCTQIQSIDLVQYQDALDELSKGKIRIFKESYTIKMSDVWLPKGSSFKNCETQASNRFIILFCSDGFTILWRITNFLQGKKYDYLKYFKS